MKYLLVLVVVILLFTSGCIGQIQSYLEVPLAIQKEVKAQSVNITEAQFESLAAIHITLNDSNIINPKTDLFKIQSIAYRSAYKAYQLYSKRHTKSLSNYRVDIACKDSLYRYYYYDSLQFAKKDVYWQKIKSLLDNSKNKNNYQLSKLVVESTDTIRIIKILNNFNYDYYKFFALENIEYNDGWLTRYWINCSSGTKYQMIAILLDQENGNIKDVIINPSEAITINQ